MRDRGLYERILGLPEPWQVTAMELRNEAHEVVVEVAMRTSSERACPECGESLGGDEATRLQRLHHC